LPFLIVLLLKFEPRNIWNKELLEMYKIDK